MQHILHKKLSLLICKVPVVLPEALEYQKQLKQSSWTPGDEVLMNSTPLKLQKRNAKNYALQNTSVYFLHPPLILQTF